MDVRNCISCGKIFNYIGGEVLCISCKQKGDENFKKVKEYIYENKDTNIYTVSEETDVSINIIQKWVREERLVFSGDSMSGIECEVCGKNIKTGRYCENCKKQMVNDLSGAFQNKNMEESKKDGSGMRYFQRER